MPENYELREKVIIALLTGGVDWCDGDSNWDYFTGTDCTIIYVNYDDKNQICTDGSEKLSEIVAVNSRMRKRTFEYIKYQKFLDNPSIIKACKPNTRKYKIVSNKSYIGKSLVLDN